AVRAQRRDVEAGREALANEVCEAVDASERAGQGERLQPEAWRAERDGVIEPAAQPLERAGGARDRLVLLGGRAVDGNEELEPRDARVPLGDGAIREREARGLEEDALEPERHH